MNGQEFNSPFRGDMTLAEAREQLRPRALSGGESCPCCTQMVRVYRRKLTGVVVQALVGLYIDHGLELGHLPTVAQHHLPGSTHQGGYLALSAHWGLMVDERHRRPDGGRTGMWSVTPLGEQWLLGEVTVPAYARVYDGRCLRLEGDPIGIRDVLGAGFNLAELIQASATPAEGGSSEPLPLFPPASSGPRSEAA